jgi:hypothetical protein
MMIRFARLSAISAFALGVSCLYATPAAAQATRTWVSGVGDDANPCSRTAPCKTFAGAISKTAANGEIDCLDPGGFGAVTITKSITLDCTGTLGGILSSLTNAINVNDSATGTPGTIRVILRGITIDGAGNGITGVNFTSGASVVIDNLLIQNVTTAGVNFRPIGTARLTVSNTLITNSNNGVLVQPTGAAGNARATLSNLQLSNNTSNALRVDATGATSGLGLLVDISNSRLDGSTNGISVITPVGSTFARVNVTSSSVVHNNNGLSVNGGSTLIRASGNLISDNGFGMVFASGGQIFGYGDNVTDGNQNPSSFTAGSPLGKN